MSSSVDSELQLEVIKRSICEKFQMTNEAFKKFNSGSTEFVKSYWTTLAEKHKPLFPYLAKLDPNLDSYLQFGADKCGVSDMKLFCDRLGLDREDLKRQLQEYS